MPSGILSVCVRPKSYSHQLLSSRYQITPTDGHDPSHIHNVSHARNMRETCAKRAKCPARISRNVRETCAKRVRNIANHRESANHPRISRNVHEALRNIAKHARSVRNALRESREKRARNVRETCAKHCVRRDGSWPSIGIRFAYNAVQIW